MSSTGEFLQLPYIPGHIYVLVPADGPNGGYPLVNYCTQMPAGLDRKYPFYEVFQPPQLTVNSVIDASPPGPISYSRTRKISSNTKKVEMVRNIVKGRLYKSAKLWVPTNFVFNIKSIR